MKYYTSTSNLIFLRIHNLISQSMFLWDVSKLLSQVMFWMSFRYNFRCRISGDNVFHLLLSVGFHYLCFREFLSMLSSKRFHLYLLRLLLTRFVSLYPIQWISIQLCIWNLAPCPVNLGSVLITISPSPAITENFNNYSVLILIN